MRLQAEKLQADMEGNEKFVFEAWEALRAAEEQQHSEAPHRRAEEAESAVRKSQNDSETHTSATELIESLSVNHQDDGEESSDGRSSAAAARSVLEERPEAVHVANVEARISALEHLEQKVSERDLTRAAGEAAEETADVEVQQLENQEAANETESHENVRSAVLQEIGKAIHGIQMELSMQRFLMRDTRRQFPEHSAQLSSLRRDLHEIRCRSVGRSWRGPRTVSSTSSRQRAHDAVILECERLRQAVERCQSDRR